MGELAVVLVGGEAGVGKTRLITELTSEGTWVLPIRRRKEQRWLGAPLLTVRP
jgi:hypothetical protein